MGIFPASPHALSYGEIFHQNEVEMSRFNFDLADTDSYEQWAENGRLDLERRAHRRWRQMLADYEAPPLDPSVDEALEDFMARKKAAMPDQWH